MNLVQELIKDLLPEQKKKKVVAVYGGGFKPPTKGHFAVVKKAIKDNPDIDEFVINIGGKERDGVTPEEAIQIWDIYKQYLPISANINIQYSSTPPIKATYDYAKNNPEEEVLFILGAREGNEDDFKDIASRTTSLDNYPNLNLRTIVTQGGVSGTAARNAGKISSKKLRPFLPDELKDEEVEQVYQMISGKVTEGRKKKPDPKKGTGKKPKGSARRLYTDEDPTDTVKVKFSTRQDIVNTLNKKSFKAKSHARQSQIINLIHQRVRAALARTKDPKKKAKLKSGFEYIKKRKEASKKKTQRLKKQKLKEKKGFGKSAGYRYRAIYKKGDKFYYMQDNPFSPGIRQEFGPFKTRAAAKRKMQSFPPGTSYRDIKEIGIDLSNYSGQVLPGDVLRAPKGFPLGGKKLEKSKQLKVLKNSREGVNRYKLSLEDSDGKKYTIRNFQMDGEYKGKKLPKWGMVRRAKKNLKEQIDSSKFNFNPYIASLTKYFMDNKMALKPLPKIQMVHDDVENGEDIFGKTAYFVPFTNEIVLFTYGRHPKDILRSYAHELVHVHQNNQGRLANYGTTDINQDDHLTQIEREAYETGNILFRSWTDSITGSKLEESIKSLINESSQPTFTMYSGITGDAWEKIWKDKNFKDKVTNVTSDEDFALDYSYNFKTGKYEDKYVKISNIPLDAFVSVRDSDYEDDDDFESIANLGDKEKIDAIKNNDLFLVNLFPYKSQIKTTLIDDSLNENKKPYKHKSGFNPKLGKDPFGLNAYARELAMGLEEQESQFKVYLDMDGVLANFDQRFRDISGMEPKEFEAKYGTKAFWNLIDEKNKISFWVGIKPMPGAADLVKAVKKYNYELLTSPSAKKQSYLGKILWVRNNSDLLGGKPHINFKRAKEKHQVKPQLSKSDILIDDREDTIGRWNAAGGTGIVYKSISQVLNDLKKLGL